MAEPLLKVVVRGMAGVNDLAGMIAELDRRLDLMHESVEKDLDEVGWAAAEEMIDTHTFQNRTWHLETSITHERHPFDTGGHASLVIAALAEYASQVEFGHPGPPPARPYPFFWPVYFKWEPVLFERMQTSVEFALYDGKSVDR